MKKNKLILIGTNNTGKFKELSYLLPKKFKKISPLKLKIKSPIESGKSFLANSKIKANYFSKISKIEYIFSMRSCVCVYFWVAFVCFKKTHFEKIKCWFSDFFIFSDSWDHFGSIALLFVEISPGERERVEFQLHAVFIPVLKNKMSITIIKIWWNKLKLNI